MRIAAFLMAVTVLVFGVFIYWASINSYVAGKFYGFGIPLLHVAVISIVAYWLYRILPRFERVLDILLLAMLIGGISMWSPIFKHYFSQWHGDAWEEYVPRIRKVS